jgi:hypothetical protein
MAAYVITVFIILVASGIGMWIRKHYLKKIMGQGLGRKVEDREITDIAEWMRAIPEDPKPRDQPPRPHG